MRRFVWSLVLSGLLARAGGQTLTPNVERARNILKEGIENKDPDVRIQAIVAGSMIGRHEAVVKRLVASLQDKDVEVRITTIRALQDMNSPDTLPVLEKTLKEDGVPEVRFVAAKALSHCRIRLEERLSWTFMKGKSAPAQTFSRSKRAVS